MSAPTLPRRPANGSGGGPGSGGGAGSGGGPGSGSNSSSGSGSGAASGSPSAGRNAGVATVGALIAAVVAFGLAPYGMKAILGLLALIAAGVIGYALRHDFAPVWREAVHRIQPRPAAAPRAPRSSWRSGGITALIAVVVGVAAWGMASFGLKALLGVVGLLGLAVVIWLFWPLLVQLLTAEPEEPRVRRSSAAPATALTPWSTRRRATFVAAATIFAGVMAWATAQLGLKGLLALVGGVGILSILLLARDRSVVFTFLGTCSLTFVLHKSFSTQDLTQSGGAISIYVTSFDVVVLLLYGIWVWEGTFAADVRAAVRRPVMLVPIIALGLQLPSLLQAPSLEHAAAEITRMLWMYGLFFYLAVRLRTRRHIWAVLAGLGVFSFLELVIVVLQWKTGGVLGLSFLGVPTSLGQRTTDTTEIGRPFGTIIHPVFMGAVLGSLGLLALALGIELKRSLTKIAAIAFVPICWLPLYIAQTRASLVAVLIAAVGIVAAGLNRGRLQWSTIRRIALGIAIGGAIASPELYSAFQANFGTGHFLEEIQSRLELNDLAGKMINDHWGLGVGLNNFELVLPRYEVHPVIFFNNPVHNLYLLYLSETGIVGFCGLVLIGVTFYNVALRLGRSRDRLFGGVGIGVAGAMGFLMVEELLGFSLRQDIPLALYWLMAGLLVACYRMSGEQGRRRAPRVRRPRPTTGKTASTRGEGAPSGRERRPAESAAARGHRVVQRLADVFSVRHTLKRTPKRTPKPNPGRALTWHRPGRDSASTRSRFSRTRRAGIGALVALALAGSLQLTNFGVAAGASPSAQLVFTAVERSTGIQGIYTANADGSEISRITPADGRLYEWPRWALGNTRIVYTVRSGPPGSAEDLELMNPDGSHVVRIDHFDFRLGQPSIDPTGRWLIFTASTPWFPEVAVYRLDLLTLESINLTAVTHPSGGFDSDPALIPGQDRVVFADSDGTRTSIATMDASGNNRSTLLNDGTFNTDPDISPDHSTLVTASYRGASTPSVGGVEFVGVRTVDWHLATVDLGTHQERSLTEGQECTSRAPSDPCAIEQMSAFLPRFVNGGREIYFTGALDSTRTCICAMTADGSASRTVIASATLAIDWFDVLTPGLTVPTPPAIGSLQRHSKVLLVSSPTTGGPNQLISASPDLMHRTVLPLPAGIVPEQARWAPDGQSIAFVASVTVPVAQGAPHPAAPPGSSRRDHVLLDDLTGTALSVRTTNSLDRNVAQLQVFLRSADGSVRQLTDPWTEDWRDGVALGDARANTDPTFSPDGQYLVVKNTSTLTGESFLLRLNLKTGDVLNLTNGTAGAVAVNDASPAYSPDGQHIAFSWTDGSITGIYTMQASDGRNVQLIANDPADTDAPVWLPDGSAVVYTRQVSGGSALARSAVTAKTQNQQTQLTNKSPSSTWQPVVAPEADRIIFLGPSGTGVSVYAADSLTGAHPRLLQPDPLNIVHYLDWR